MVQIILVPGLRLIGILGIVYKVAVFCGGDHDVVVRVCGHKGHGKNILPGGDQDALQGGDVVLPVALNGVIP